MTIGRCTGCGVGVGVMVGVGAGVDVFGGAKIFVLVGDKVVSTSWQPERTTSSKTRRDRKSCFFIR